MAVSFYLTHPQVMIDPDVPVPLWGLSELGRARAAAFAARNLLPGDAVLVSSAETKARELADILAAGHGNPVAIRQGFGENDRSSTGFLPPPEFEEQVSLLFDFPDRSANGWETANDAQRRIVGAVMAALAEFGDSKPLVFVGHGCVGTLLKCHVGKRDISRTEDQRERADPGGGNLFAFDLAAGRLLCDWTAFEDWQEV
jgi:broad specificity phosphatase PhoE